MAIARKRAHAITPGNAKGMAEAIPFAKFVGKSRELLQIQGPKYVRTACT